VKSETPRSPSAHDPVLRGSNLVRLLQLASPTLPVGAYSYSQGLEAAIDAGVVRDAPTAERWIADVLEFSVAGMEAPLLWRMLHGEDVNDMFVASRETAELRAETLQMGHSLCRLLHDLGITAPDGEVAYPTAYAAAARHWQLDPRQALVAYLWSWAENQVLAAVKAVPLGQTDGQKMLLSLGKRIEEFEFEDGLNNFAPGLAILSTQHETQYSRLFRS
jgi:urease accessory protein